MDFKERLNKISLRNAKKRHVKHTTWPMEKRIEVVSQYLVLGNMKLVSAVTGVSHDLIRAWKGQAWWKDLENEIRASQDIELDTKLSKIVDKSLEAVMDRVEHGEHFYDQKTGKIKRKPVALRDVHRVSVDLMNKRDVLRGRDDEHKQLPQAAVLDQLKSLALEFAKWNEKQKPVIELEEVEDAVYSEPKETTEETTDALHEEREEGLQERTGLGTQEEAGESQGEGSTQFSPIYDGESRKSY